MGNGHHYRCLPCAFHRPSGLEELIHPLYADWPYLSGDLPISVLQREPVGATLGLSGSSGKRRFRPRFLARGTLILSVAFSVKLLHRETSIRRVKP